MSNKSELKLYFEPGDRPRAIEFADLIDSSLNWEDDKATDADAENSSIDNRFITPKTARKSVEKYAPVKKVNTKSPNASGEVSLVIADIPGLTAGIDSKQATLVSGNNIKSINGATILASGDLLLATPAALDLKMNLPAIVKLSSNISSATDARATVAAFSFAALANKKYRIELIGSYQNDTVTAGGSLGFNLSAGTGFIRGSAEMQTTANGLQKELISVISTANTDVNSFITSSQVSAINTAGFINASLYFECITAGNFQVQWGSGVAGTNATLNSGTVLIVTLLN
ncbi:hypothetical protein [Flavobacterium sp. UBA7682]|uniref:hypothetical protein n=1 Tax=Flavobacterium sp. UBA7682 TaxID=1946560 RepID=UPI0025BAD2AE|nr:hypothetical protein [Flavobacterium sp. UBA7682]